MNFTEVLIPIVVSGVMPVAIVALIARIYIKRSEHRMNVMVKAIENGAMLFTSNDPEWAMNYLRERGLHD